MNGFDSSGFRLQGELTSVHTCSIFLWLYLSAIEVGGPFAYSWRLLPASAAVRWRNEETTVYSRSGAGPETRRGSTIVQT